MVITILITTALFGSMILFQVMTFNSLTSAGLLYFGFLSILLIVFVWMTICKDNRFMYIVLLVSVLLFILAAHFQFSSPRPQSGSFINTIESFHKYKRSN